MPTLCLKRAIWMQRQASQARRPSVSTTGPDSREHTINLALHTNGTCGVAGGSSKGGHAGVR